MSVQSSVPAAPAACTGYGVQVVRPSAATEPEIGSRELLDELAASVIEGLGGGRIWHVNSTSTGGGVAELLRSSMIQHRLLGLPATWLVSAADPAFYDLTKRIHHGLHGRESGGAFDARDEDLYRRGTGGQVAGLLRYIRPGDVAVLHDPQTLGVAPRLIEAGARVAWRSHIGTTRVSPVTERTWALLRQYLEPLRYYIFTMPEYAPAFAAASRVRIIHPSTDPRSVKNRELAAGTIADLLAGVGLTGDAAPSAQLGRTVHGAPLPAQARVILQVSRWDPLKDMAGVLTAFVAYIARRRDTHLVLAGPDPTDIPDDPEGQRVYAEVVRLWEGVTPEHRRRIHLVTLPLTDAAANAEAVNALQRRADVVTQKSLEEGFGLTVTEAMWKGRPIVASRVGGLSAQIVSTQTGVLVDEPTDLAAFGEAVVRLLDDRGYAQRLGRAAHQRCVEEFLTDRETTDYLRLYQDMLGG